MLLKEQTIDTHIHTHTEREAPTRSTRPLNVLKKLLTAKQPKATLLFPNKERRHKAHQ